MLSFYQFLLEKTGHSYSSTQVNLPVELANKMKKWGRGEILNADLHGKEDLGREDNIHITIRYGLIADDIDKVRQIVQNERPISLTIGKTSIFINNPEFDVVKFNITSSDLHSLNKKLKKCEHDDLHPKYVPHCTIAYVKKGLGRQHVGSNPFVGTKVMVNNIIFSDRKRNHTIIQLKG